MSSYDYTPTCNRLQVVVQRLMAAEADPNVQDRLGLSALMVASISGEAECVRVLMRGGAKLDLLEDHGYSALALAELHGQHLVVKLLKQPPARERGRKQRLERQATTALATAALATAALATAALTTTALGSSGATLAAARAASAHAAAAAPAAQHSLPGAQHSSPEVERHAEMPAEPAQLPASKQMRLEKADAKANADKDVAAQIVSYLSYQRSLSCRACRTVASHGASTVHGGTAFTGADGAAVTATQPSLSWTVHDGRFFAHHVRAHRSVTPSPSPSPRPL